MQSRIPRTFSKWSQLSLAQNNHTLKILLFPNKKCNTPINGGGAGFVTVTQNPCAPNPCQNGGACAQNHNTFSCSCPSSFTGQRCDLLLQQPLSQICSPSPCLNGGVCIPQSFYAFSCSCPANCCQQLQLSLSTSFWSEPMSSVIWNLEFLQTWRNNKLWFEPLS